MAKARKDNRISLTLKFTPGVDDDLISWLQALPNGMRQTRIKTALRAAMRQPIDDPLRRIDETTAAIWQALSEMPGWFDDRLSRIGVAPAAQDASAVEPAPQLAQDEIEARQQRLKKAKW